MPNAQETTILLERIKNRKIKEIELLYEEKSASVIE